VCIGASLFLEFILEEDMEKWMVYAKKADFNELSKKHNITPVTARIIYNRDIKEEDYNLYLKGDKTFLYSPFLLKDIDIATDIIINKIKEGKKIRVIGDYDIDGVCSTFILTNGLLRINANVDMDIPDRIKDGYGININIIDKALNDGIDTIITCDNGISAKTEIDYAMNKGMTVIITDHHNIPENKAVANAIINPKQIECTYPFKEICGAVVAYKLIEAVYKKTESTEEVDDFIEFAGIATIGDVVSLKDENRIFAKEGIKALKETTNKGLRALIDVNNIDLNNLSSYHIGFIIGPCLNAGGRLETAKMAYELFNSKNYEEARLRAEELKNLNDIRKGLTEEGTKKAIGIANEMINDRVLVIYLKGVHESIAGIIAGRVRESFYKPAIILTDAEEEGFIKGSARSIEGYNIFDGLNEVKEYLHKFGGHEMAAGMSLLMSNLEEFRKSLNNKCQLLDEELIRKIWIDIPLPIDYANEEFIKELSLLEPFGKDNEKPCFADKNLKIKDLKILGKNQNVIKLTVVNERLVPITAMIFNNTESFTNEVSNRYGVEEFEKAKMGMDNKIEISAIYYPQINEFNNKKTIQIIINKYQMH